MNLSSLNPQQLKAVKFGKGACLVIAGAGSGKTRSITYRVAYLIKSGVNPSNILLLTFTNKAANEMLDRASKLVKTKISITGGTFHSFAVRIIRQYTSSIGYDRNFSIMDMDDSAEIMNLIRSKYPAIQDKYFPKKKTLINILSKSNNTNSSIRSIIIENYSFYEKWIKVICKILKEYKSYKKEKGLMDFDDLLLNLRTILKNKTLRNRISKKYQYILVDEYQDTNVVQAEIIQQLSYCNKNIMVVGDDAQSVYAFRGADISNILDFPKQYKNTTIIKLERNYRSNRGILDFTNDIVLNAEEKYDKKLFTKLMEDRKPLFYRPNSTSEQSSIISNTILSSRIPRNEMAVLFRAGHHSNDLEVYLNTMKIKFVKFGGLKFMSMSHIKDIVSMMRNIYYPSDIVAWNRSLSLLEGVGPATVRKIVSTIETDGLNGLEQYKKFSYGQKLFKYSKLMMSLIPQKNPSIIIKKVIDYYSPYLKKKYNKPEKRLKDIGSLIDMSKRYKTPKKLISDLTLDPDRGKDREVDKDTLILSTIHSAKGLEWKIVFIINVIEGCIPSEYATKSKDIEEERRVFYVACTRAKEQLHLLSPAVESNYGKNFQIKDNISRFLKTEEFENLVTYKD